MPVRIQRKRTKGWRMPPNAVYVGRPTKWGNPFDWREMGRAEAVRRYILWITGWDGDEDLPNPSELGGKDLACWCSLDESYCHADILLALAQQDDSSLLWMRALSHSLLAIEKLCDSLLGKELS